MNLTIDQVSFLRDMKGAPASIVLALALTGLSLLQKELELATGYSDKTIARGLALLELHDLVYYNGRSNGWCLPPNFQLSLFPSASLGRGTRRISVLASSSSLETDLQIQNQKAEEEKKRPNPENFRLCTQDPVYQLLIDAGVGRNSPKMRELIASKLEEDYVRSWTRYFEWWKRESANCPGHFIDGRTRFTVGTLIHILLDGDPAPASRCENCLEPVPCHCAFIKT